MITGELKNKIDQLWEILWTEGNANPLTNIEQLTYLLFMKDLDSVELGRESDAEFLGIPYEGVFPKDKPEYRWSTFKNIGDAQEVYRLMTQEIFPFIKNLKGDTDDTAFSRYMREAIFQINKPATLQKAISILDVFPTRGLDVDFDNDKQSITDIGDIYEYLLSKLSTAGKNGQFRTPRHIIDMMVELMQPTIKDIISDPAMGSAGFLVSASRYLKRKKDEWETNTDNINHFHNQMFHGNDTDTTMLRLGAMNMKKVKLGEVLSLKKGKKATVLAEQTTLSQRYIQIDDLRNNNNLKFTESLNMTEALPDDILIAWDGANAGTVGYGLSGAVGSTITVLKKNERYKEKIISDYLGVFLESKSQYLREHSTGATIPHLNKNILLDLQLELLGIEEQENIICILNTIKRLITKRKLQLDELNLLVKSRFNEMFGENKIFESIDNLFDIIDGDRGKNYPKSDELFSEEYCLFLNTKNVTKNGFSFDTKQFITKTKDKLLRKGKLERYDIVLTTRGTVGNVAYYDELIKYKHLRINSGMVILRPKTPNLNQKFIIHVLRNNNYSRVISGSAQPQLPITKLKKILLPLPPLALQNEFADFVALVDKSQFACEIAIKVWRNSLKFSII